MKDEVINNQISLKTFSDCPEFSKLISKGYESEEYKELRDYFKKILKNYNLNA